MLEDLGKFVCPWLDASLFVGRTGQPLRARVSRKHGGRLEEIGLPDMRFHDLRHFSGTMAAAAGASTKEVMA